jgi:hypothetical protein
LRAASFAPAGAGVGNSLEPAVAKNTFVNDHKGERMSHHHHDHHHDAGETLSLEEKMIKLLEHWIRHNEDHETNYREWAGKAQGEGLADVAGELNAAADLTADTTKVFSRALSSLKTD